MKIFWVHQESQLDHYPWTELGDSEELFWYHSCCTSCGPLLHVNNSRRFPIHDVPADSPGDHRLQLGALITYPNICDVGPQTRGRMRNIIPADKIQPVTVRTHDEAGNPLSPPYEVEGLYRSQYNHPHCDWPTCLNNELTYHCHDGGGPQPLTLQGRLVVPILRIVNWPGWQLSMHVSGQVPKSVRYQWDGNPAFLDGCFRFKVSSVHTQSWSMYMRELNTDADGTPCAGGLWEWEPYDFCENQPVSFDLFVDVLWCDQVVDMFQMHPFDNEYFAGHPIATQMMMTNDYCLNISNVRLWPPA
jgi:hypothetical protein